MPGIELIPYDASRKEPFTAEVEEMCVRFVGDDLDKPMAYIKFTDGGADIQFFATSPKGDSVVEEKEAGTPNVKTSTDIGKFAAILHGFGYKTILGIDPDDPIFETIPPLVGKKTTWGEKKKGKKVDSNGDVIENDYINFMIVGIEGKTIDEKDFKKYGIIPPNISELSPKTSGTVATPSTPSAKPKDPAKPAEDLKQAWKDLLIEVLMEPLNEAGIHKAIIEADKTLKPDNPIKALHSRMAKVRKVTLGALMNEKFLTINEDGKFELV